MRVNIDPPSSGPVGTVSLLNGDEHGLGNVCYIGPWAFVCSDENEDAERWFRPDMRASIKHHLRREHFRTAVFCTYEQFRRKEKWAEFWYDTTPQRRISLFISGLSPKMKIVFEFCCMFAIFAILASVALLIERYAS